MNTMLSRIRTQVLEHLSEDPSRMPLGGVGIFHSRSPQSIHDVPIHMPFMVLVTSGVKEIVFGGRRLLIKPGELLLLPGGCRVEVANYPGNKGDHYLGLAMGFPEESITQFRRSYGDDAMSQQSSLWSVEAPEEVVASMGQWIDWCCQHPVTPALAQHRQVEMLMHLARAGSAGNLLLNREASWRERVAQLVSLEPSREWEAAEVCRRLAIGESTLRRRLQEEGTGFREIMEETRLVAGLALLQETFWPVGQVAEAVGYRSQSRFSERFKRRFGLTPTELKRTRMNSSGENTSG